MFLKLGKINTILLVFMSHDIYIYIYIHLILGHSHHNIVTHTHDSIIYYIYD